MKTTKMCPLNNWINCEQICAWWDNENQCCAILTLAKRFNGSGKEKHEL
jgi:hypothetical protein